LSRGSGRAGAAVLVRRPARPGGPGGPRGSGSSRRRRQRTAPGGLVVIGASSCTRDTRGAEQGLRSKSASRSSPAEKPARGTAPRGQRNAAFVECAGALVIEKHHVLRRFRARRGAVRSNTALARRRRSQGVG